MNSFTQMRGQSAARFSGHELAGLKSFYIYTK